MTEAPIARKVCEHYWAWVSPAGTSNSARLCMLCYEPDPTWLNTIIYKIDKEQDMNDDIPLRIKTLVMNYFNDHVEKTDKMRITVEQIYIVWFSKTLQNWKAMVSTTIPDGMYYEVTHNGDEDETYLDAYKKFDNVVIPD